MLDSLEEVDSDGISRAVSLLRDQQSRFCSIQTDKAKKKIHFTALLLMCKLNFFFIDNFLLNRETQCQWTNTLMPSDSTVLKTTLPPMMRNFSQRI